MSSLHHVAPAKQRSSKAPAGARAAPARQFHNDPVTARPLLPQMRAQLGGAWQLVCLWRHRSKDRAVLRSMSARDVRDFCPRQAEAEEEMNKPFWRG